ncbi:YrhB domain-containing protein [Burkholderia cenocepacia]|uniref:YrhB domain-containing protein n=1 Tax=Burkholderia cenocepacia TaxID=95486 RepID=UPI002AB16DF0|nr:YrhB domain-containing protein [Burkholderia cenocepacia]
MELTAEQAKEVAQRAITKTVGEGCDAVVIDEYTQEFDVGWVFYYQSSRFLESGDMRDRLVGNAPLFVSRADGQATSISYHRPIAESIQAYHACGDTNGYEESQIRLMRWFVGANKVQAIRLIRQHSPVSLAEAKHAVDQCLAGHEVVVAARDVASAKQLAIDLAEVGFHGIVTFRSTRR